MKKKQHNGGFNNGGQICEKKKLYLNIKKEQEKQLLFLTWDHLGHYFVPPIPG